MFSTLRRRKKGWLQIMDVKLIRFFKFAFYSGVLKFENTVLTKFVEVWNLEEIYGHACLAFYFLNPLTAEWVLRALIDFLTPDDFTRQWGTPWQEKG